MISLEELRSFLTNNGVPAYRANQVFHAVYKEGKNDYELMNVLPGNVMALLNEKLPVYSATAIKSSESKDKKTIKILLELLDGEKIEAVLMKFDDGRKTVCVSSQVGCTLGCAFCSTGKGGFKRNLTYEEITDQVLYFEHLLNKTNEHVNHVVFMGMGEPFLNYDEVMKAVKILNNPVAFDIGMRNMTISTSGIISGIENLMNDNKQINLAISLHAPNDTIRKKIMPIAKKYSLHELMEVCRKYIEITHRRISYEYIMLNGINDKDEHAHELANLLRGQLCHVNLIPYNETKIRNMKSSSKNRIDSFRDILELNNIPVTVRVSLGKDIEAACGQLAGKK